MDVPVGIQARQQANSVRLEVTPKGRIVVPEVVVMLPSRRRLKARRPNQVFE